MTNIQKKLDNYITAEMAYWDFSGVIRIVQKGAVLYETSRGYANIAFGIKIQCKRGLWSLRLRNSSRHLQL